jgi:hypothetical protein
VTRNTGVPFAGVFGESALGGERVAAFGKMEIPEIWYDVDDRQTDTSVGKPRGILRRNGCAAEVPTDDWEAGIGPGLSLFMAPVGLKRVVDRY